MSVLTCVRNKRVIFSKMYKRFVGTHKTVGNIGVSVEQGSTVEVNGYQTWLSYFCRFLLDILGVYRAQDLAKYSKRLHVFMQLTNKNIAFMKFMHSV